MLSKPAASSGGARLAMLCGGVVAAGVAHALLQEQMLYAMPAKMPLVVTAYEFGVCSSLSGAYLLLAGGGGARAPLWPLARISALVFASLVSGNVALRWVSFPVKVIVKSCKLQSARDEVANERRRKALDKMDPTEPPRHRKALGHYPA